MSTSKQKITTLQQIKEQLPAVEGVNGCAPVKLYPVDGWYLPGICYLGTLATKQLFEARPTDIILATLPKSGTTWLKALTFAVTHRNTANNFHYNHPDHPLKRLNPHDCIHTLEFQLYVHDEIPDLDSLPDPRMFQTHIPYSNLLPPSIIETGCRVVYLCRDPKDTFISMWHFSTSFLPEPLPLEVALDHFCNGVSFFGPFWDHVLGYWKASLERPDRVLFMKYEELMSDPVSEVKRLAEFLGCPFSKDEEESGDVEGIVKLCGFENLSSLEVNKCGVLQGKHEVPNKSFFRQGKVGDWVNHLTPEMASRLDQITLTKFAGFGLTL